MVSPRRKAKVQVAERGGVFQENRKYDSGGRRMEGNMGWKQRRPSSIMRAYPTGPSGTVRKEKARKMPSVYFISGTTMFTPGR